MNDRQKYLFDLQGYLLIEDVLGPEDCDLAIEKIKKRVKPMEKTPMATTPTALGRAPPVSTRRANRLSS